MRYEVRELQLKSLLVFSRKVYNQGLYINAISSSNLIPHTSYPKAQHQLSGEKHGM
jgi:hypothetical protein